MAKCSFDCETYSSVDLKASGVYPYAEHPDTEVLCACWALDDGPVQSWTWGSPPPQLPAFDEVWAYNAQFDATLWYEVLHKRCGWAWPGWDRFRCSMVAAAYGNLPGKLDQVTRALGTAEKDKLGARLMMTLCKPAHETLKNDDPKRRHTPEALARLTAYCAQDVEAERALHALLPVLPESELALWQLDQEINRRGVYLDRDLVHRLIEQAEDLQELYRAELAEVTGGIVGSETQIAALIDFLRSQGLHIHAGRGAMDKEAVDRYLRLQLTPAARRALELRRLLGKSSLAKLRKMLSACCQDGRLRGLLAFYGAHQTGRWAGRLVQPQNLPRGLIDEKTAAATEAKYGQALTDLATARAGCPEWFAAIYGEQCFDMLSTLIRPCLRAAPGKVLVVADYSAIEARGVAWASGQQWRLDVFKGDGKIYETSASRTLGIPIEKVGKRERGVGKVTELALGYQGGPGALERFGAVERYGVERARLKPIVEAWRQASPQVVKLWHGLQDAAHEAVREPGRLTRYRYAAFKMVGPHLRMALPSGRNLWYRNAYIEYGPAPWDEDQLIPQLYFYGENEDGLWGLQKAYGGSLTNNFVQGMCRDIMAHGLANAVLAGFHPVLTVHDELVCEEDDPGTEAGRAALVERLEAAMCDLPAWASGMPVTADGYCGTAYRK